MEQMATAVAHYNLLERLGAGAFGDVYRARDMKVGRTVALMTAPVELTSDPDRRASFLRDARAAVALNHPNIAALFDVVEQGGRCYLAYEFAAGPSLRDEMGERSVNTRRAVELAAQIADALAEGHSRGLTHGDLRPENIVVTLKGSPKILNFGLAPWTAGGQARAAASAPDSIGLDLQGVAGYLSPEQALGGKIDERSDIFSFGVILYEMLTGQNPFAGATPAATAVNIVRLTPPPASTVNPALSSDIDALLARLLAKPLEARPASALTVSSDLRRIVVALDKREDAAPPEVNPAQTSSTGGWWIAVLIGIALLVAVWFYAL
jgi:serine/threonine protein kinase